MPINSDQLQSLGKARVVTEGGDKVGTTGQVYLDDQSGAPEWVTVNTGLFGTSESFVPLQGARIDGQDVVVAYDKDTIGAAPRIEGDGSLSPAEEDSLYRHYGLASTAGQVDTDRVDTTDEAMSRSEERVQVGTQAREAGRARLRKHVETEQVTQTVPVAHEEPRVVREPITPENYDRSVDGPELTDAVHEVTLHDEVPVVDKEVVPVERVRLDTETVTEQQTVTTDVSQEKIEVDQGRDTTPQR